jgi:hypothetical protein
MVFSIDLTGLQEKNIKLIKELWFDSAETVLIVPSSDTVILGKKNIISFTEENFINFKGIKFLIKDTNTIIDLIKGRANVYAQIELEIALNQANKYQNKLYLKRHYLI